VRRLDRLIRGEQLRADIATYEGAPPSAAEIAIGDVPLRFDLDDDTVDYDTLHGSDPGT